MNVSIKGTTTGVVTGPDGKYTITTTDPNAILIFSIIGYLSDNVPVEGKSIVDVILNLDIRTLEEVVVVGYGTQKVINLTGSVASIDAEKIAQMPITQTSMALQGMASGLIVKQNSGEPGQDQGTILIRGIGTVGNSNPLILVDGISSDINSVDPNDIESISVLKDAASSSIYGSRAANGVVLITTKRAQQNRFIVNYNNYIGWQEATELPEIVSGYDHMVMINEANKNMGKPEPFSQAYIDAYAQNAPSDAYPETDWLKEMLKDRALQQNHFISVNGGGEKVSILGSVSSLDQQGLSINNRYKRTNLRLNTDIKLKENLKIGFDILLQESDDATAGSPWYFLMRYPKNLAGKNENGTWGIGWDGTNDWAYETDGGVSHNKSYNAVAKLNFNWQPIDGLNLELHYVPEIRFNHSKNFSKHVDLFYPNGDIFNPTPFKASLTERYTRNIANTIKALVSYSKSFGKSNLSALVGFEQMDYRYDYMEGYRNEFLLENYEVLNAGPTTNQRATGSATESALRSYFGRLDYNLDEKYLFEANLRYDGSSKFNKGHRYGLFPSFSAGWRITEEEFMKTFNWLDNLKIRASWGQLGNQNIGDYPSSSVITLGQDYVFNNSVAAQGAAIIDASNPKISWETTEMTNFGIDLSIFSKLSLSLEYYIKNTKEILLRMPIPKTTGLNPPYQNAGKVRNAGWDFSGNFKDRKGDFEYSLTFNFSDVKNKIVDLVGTGPYIYDRTIQMEGEPIWSLYGLEAEGLFQTPEEILGHAAQYGTVKPGDIKYKDQLTIDNDGDGVLDKADGIINAQDRVIIGSDLPRQTYSFEVYGKYKNFDISLFFQGVGKVDGYIDQHGVMAFYMGGTAREWQKDYWRPDNTDAAYPRLTFGFPNNEQVSSYWKRSAAYLRLKNIQAGYTVPKGLLDKTFLSSCRVFFSGQNLFTIKNFYPGFDPEAPIGTGAYYPMVKVYSFGISIKF